MSNFKEGQVHQLANALEVAEFTPEQITKLGQYSRLGDFRLVLDGQAEIVRHPVVETEKEVKTYLRRLCVAKLGAIDDIGTYTKAKKVFKAGFDADFENWGIVFSGIAPETDIAVDELVKDGKFPEFLGNTAEKLEKRRLLGAQWLKFCKDHSNKLRQDGYATFAVLTKNDEPIAVDLSNVFVARVGVYERGQLFADVNHFDIGYVWYARYQRRVLSPQQKLIPLESA